jgi:hypothetical protein
VPWKELKDVPEQVKTHNGASLTIAQANRWAELRDGIASGDNPPDSPEAVAWVQWEKEYKLSDDKKSWVEEQKTQAAARKAFASRMLDSQGIIVAVHLHRVTLAADDDLLWVEACTTLDFTDENNRHVTITKNDLESLVRNFESDVVGRKVFVDIDHMAEFAASDDPMSRARIGTVEKIKLSVSKNPQTKGEPVLLCGVRLNKRGTDAVEGGEFGYISAVIHSKWKDRRVDHQAEFVAGKVLTSITLTNDPFVPWLAEVGSDVTPEKIAASRALLTRMADNDKVERFVLSLEDNSDIDDDKENKSKLKNGDLDMDENKEALARETAKRAELEQKLKDAEDKLALTAKAEKESKDTVERLKRETLHSKSLPVLEALKKPNKAGRLIPPAILARVEKLCKLVLTGEGEATALTDTETALAAVTGDAGDAFKGFMTELKNQVKSEKDALPIAALILMETAGLLNQFKETETVEPEAQASAQSRKPADKDKPRGELVADRYKELLSRKPDEVPELRKFKEGSEKRITEALKLAETQLIAEGVIE